MQRATCNTVVFLCGLLLYGCSGWHARGVGGKPLPFEAVYVQAPRNAMIGRALRDTLSDRGVTVSKQRNDADVVLELRDERFDRRVLSVDPGTGKVREVEVGLQALFSVRDAEGKLLLADETLTWSQDYVFDEGSLLGTVHQDRTLRRDLAERAATTLLLRLRTVDPTPSP